MSKNKARQSLMNAFYTKLEALCKEFDISSSHLFDMLLNNEKVGYEKNKIKRSQTIRDMEDEIKLAELEQKLRRSSWDRQMQIVNAIADVCIELTIKCKGTNLESASAKVINGFLSEYGIPEENFKKAYTTEMERIEKEVKDKEIELKSENFEPVVSDPIEIYPEEIKEDLIEEIEGKLSEDSKTEN